MKSENMLLIGSREKTQNKLIELIREKVDREENLIVTDTADHRLYDNSIDMVRKHGYKVVRLDPYVKNHDSINIMQYIDDSDKENLCSVFPEYLIGEVFIGEPEEYLSPNKYTWSFELFNFMLFNDYRLNQFKKFFKKNSVQRIVDKLYAKEPQLVTLLGGEPPWRIADDLSDIQNTICRRLAVKKEVEMLSRGTYDLAQFGQEKTIVYVAPMPECRLEPLIIERFMDLNKDSRIPCTVVMDERSCIREPYIYNWNINSSYLLTLRTDSIPSANFIKRDCRQTYYCA